MGIGPIALTVYRSLVRDGIMKPGQSIMELGSQDLYAAKCPALVGGLFDELERPSAGLRPAHLQGSARSLMEMLGFKYECIDTDGRHGALRLNLNHVLSVGHGIGLFDIVTNHGTTEHVFDQANCFRAMHDLCSVGGVMIHCVPMRGYQGHCFYLYQPELFQQIATDNGYEMIGLWTSRDDGPLAERAELIAWDDLRLAGSGNVLLSAVMRRKSDAPFRVPFQTSRYVRPS